MTAISKVKPRLVSPVGYESAQHGEAGDDFSAGDLVIISGTPTDARWDCVYEPAVAAVAHGIVLKDCKEGGTVEVAYEGEMDGFSSLTPGDALSVASGAIDDTAPVQSDTDPAINYTITAVSATRIRFRFG